jgi:4-hydroxy-3-methylbut-2-enyl diphosphate reductase
MNIEKIFLASPRGFCAGVKRAVDIVEAVLKKHGAPVYVRHNIVHNIHVVKDFEKKGAIFVEDLDKIPEKSVTVFSSHGSAPSLYVEACKRKLVLYDATCPLVTKVHLEAKRFADMGYFIVYIGKKGHPEAVGVLGEIPKEEAFLIEKLEDLDKEKVPKDKKLIILTQTTLSFDDTNSLVDEIKSIYPSAILPPAFDICFSTQNRQNAVKKLAKKTKNIIVIGSKESSNSNKLRYVAEREGARAYLIDDETDIDTKWFKNVREIGISAGASAPEKLVKRVITFLSTKDTILEDVETVKETVLFPLPNNI